MIAKELIIDYQDSDRVLFRGTDFIYLKLHSELLSRISNYTITFPSKGMMSDERSQTDGYLSESTAPRSD